MPSSSRSDSFKNQKLDHDSFVAFDHAAAGHDGVRCTPSGSFIAKPCTAQEIAFYESTAVHPAFREYIPIYIGTLSSAGQQQPAAALAAAAATQQGAIVIPDSDHSTSAETPTSETAQQATTSTGPSTSGPARDVTWAPSASSGKKLDTGLSIVLENVASGFKRPNVLDVKLGARLWADDAIPAKRAKLDAVSKETTSSSLGFRIAGMKVWTGVNGEADAGSKTNPYITRYQQSGGAKGEVTEMDGYKRYDKWYGRSFTAENVKSGLETYLAGAKAAGTDRSKVIAARLADGLRRVQQVLESEESRMYSSSVLIIYEGDPEAMELALKEEKRAKEAPAQESDQEDEDEDDFEGFELQDIANLPAGENGTINITIDPQTTQLGDIEDEEDEEEGPKVHDLRLIDFAHASWTPGQGPDENVLTGVRNLARIFEELAAS
ncbi:inositol polyphosphate multikinase [Aspergillus mulundensis]|uniref:Kinase n=1 Tax=Aspergillus mulundensis TaxID=1810919 RepID=A0A3D8QM46_9EURO|nr:Kinase [Aspergillus mulundensis]RDW62903.1 Kinase [Aspergillus mulundensis]